MAFFILLLFSVHILPFGMCCSWSGLAWRAHVTWSSPWARHQVVSQHLPQVTCDHVFTWIVCLWQLWGRCALNFQQRPSSWSFWQGGRQPSALHTSLVQELQLPGEAFAATMHISFAAGPTLPREQLWHSWEPQEKDLCGSSSKTRHQNPY